VSVDLGVDVTDPNTPSPPDSGGGTPPDLGSGVAFKPVDIGPLRVSSELLSNKNLSIVVSADGPVTNFDLYFELPANTPQSGVGAPELTGPKGWGISSNFQNNILEVSAFMPLNQVNGQIVPAPLLAGEALLTLEFKSIPVSGQLLSPIYLSGELNEEQNLLIERSTVTFTPEISTPNPTFTHWRSNETLPGVALNAELVPEKIAPKDKTEAGIGLTDVLSALKIYLGKPLPAEFTSPFNAVAADFDGSGSVGLNDVLGLLKYYLGKPTGGLAPEWVFVNANSPTSGINKNNTNLPELDLTDPAPELIGILRGDVDGSFSL